MDLGQSDCNEMLPIKEALDRVAARLRAFHADHSGAVTTDYVTLTAAVVAVCVVVIISVADGTNNRAARLSREIAQIEPGATHLPSNGASGQYGGGAESNNGTGMNGAVSASGAGDSTGESGTAKTTANSGSGDEGASGETETTSGSGSDANSGQSSNTEQDTSSSSSSSGSGSGAGSGGATGGPAESDGCTGSSAHGGDSQGSDGTHSSGCNT